MVSEKKIAKQLKKLNYIKPDKDWAVFCKQDILGKDSKINFKEVLFAPLQKPALVFAFRASMVLMLVLAGASFYMYHLNRDANLNLATNVGDGIGRVEKESAVELEKSLEDIKLSLGEINSALINIENIENRGQALAAVGVIKEMAKNTRQQVENIKQSPETSPKTLTSLIEVEETCKEITEDSVGAQDKMIREAIAGLQTQELSEKNQKRLTEAKRYFEGGQINEATLLIIKIMEN